MKSEAALWFAMAALIVFAVTLITHAINEQKLHQAICVERGGTAIVSLGKWVCVKELP